MQLGLRTFAVAKASDYFSEAAHYAEEKDTAEGQTEANDKWVMVLPVEEPVDWYSSRLCNIEIVAQVYEGHWQ